MKIRVFEAFAGYGSQAMALERLKQDYPDFDYVVVGVSEIEKNAIAAYKAVHGNCLNYGDISKIDWNNVPDFDLFTYSFPCFVSGTLIQTSKGYVPIENIKVGDSVLTHTNNYCKVEKIGHKPSSDLYKIKGMMFDEIICTGEHPFYTRKLYRKWDNANRRSQRLFQSPVWVDAKDLDKDTYLGYAINTKSELPMWNGSVDNRWGHNKKVNKLKPLLDKSAFWYLMGRYIGDGWKRTNTKHGSGIVICCSDRNFDSLVKALNELNLHYSTSVERTVTKLHISMNELNSFVDRYGYYSYGKRIDADTINLPIDLLKSFIDGVLDSDGCYTNNEYKITSVSRDLVYGLQQCIAKVYKCPVRMYKFIRPKTTTIEGRVVNQRDTYTLVWHTDKRKQDHAFYEEGYVWFPLKSAERQNETDMVYNIQVNNDHSYTANGVIVHNCQDVSTAGFQNGLSEGSGTRSSLLWECRKAIIAKRPKYLLMENVPNLVSKKFMPYVQKWMDELASYGYNNYISKLNAKDFGTPQNRNRVFMVSILGDDKFEFPKPFLLDKRLKDILEKNVDEKFYIDPDRAKDMIAMLDIKQSDKILRIGHYAPSGHNGCTIVHPEGIAPTVMDNHGCPTAIIEIYGFGRSRDKKGNVVSRHLNSYINCLHTQVSNGRNMDVLVAEQHFDLTFAIRKLTPTECFRLMDVADADIKKIQDAGISKSKQYVLTGNSICVNVLYHIMEQMFCIKESDNRNSQLTLF